MRIAALSGELSEDKVRAITQGMETALAVLDPAARTAAIDGVEAELVEFARAASVERIRRKITLLRFALDPHGADARAMAAFDDQHLRFTPLADGVQVSGWLTQETAAAVLTCLDQTVDAWFRSGTDGAGRAMTRAATRAHLVALALGELAGRMLTSASSGTKQRQRPHLTLTLDLADYRAGLGGRLRLPGHGEALLARASTDRIRCDSDLTAVVTRPMGPRGEPSSRWTSGAALDPSDYRRLADWLRTQSREVLFVGRAERTAPPRLRRALDLRDGGCVAPGCDVDPSRCEAHHVQHWTHGGGTDLDNMALVYRRHHHLVHEGGWTLTADRHRHPGSTGYWQLTPPGRERPP